MSGRLLEVRGLRVEFPTRRGRLVAVDGVSFSIAPGEILGVVGESGAGKSLTGMSIIGLLEPPGRIAAGEILLEGDRVPVAAQQVAHPGAGPDAGEFLVLLDGDHVRLPFPCVPCVPCGRSCLAAGRPGTGGSGAAGAAAGQSRTVTVPALPSTRTR